MITEKEIKAPNGIMFIIVLLAAQIGSIAFLLYNMINRNLAAGIIAFLIVITL